MPAYPNPLKTTLIVLAAALAALAVGASPAAAAKPCWKQLFIDESDGRIDKTYPVHCYREAIKHLDEDQLIYGSYAQDINRALLSAIRKLENHGVVVGPNTLIPPGPGGPSKGSKSTKPKGFFQNIAKDIGPGNAASIPLPLLILAGLGVLLVAAAAASYAAKRIQGRRGPPSAPET